MKNLSVVSKIFAYIALTSGALWIGAYLARLSVTYILFEAENLTLSDFVTPENLSGIIETVLPSIFLTFVLYIILIISFTLFLFISKISLKQNGWLFIITVIIYFTLPFQIYLMIIDYNLIVLQFENNFNSQYAINLVKEGFETLNTFPIIMILCYITIPYFLIFKPFTIKPDEN